MEQGRHITLLTEDSFVVVCDNNDCVGSSIGGKLVSSSLPGLVHINHAQRRAGGFAREMHIHRVNDDLCAGLPVAKVTRVSLRYLIKLKKPYVVMSPGKSRRQG